MKNAWIFSSLIASNLLSLSAKALPFERSQLVASNSSNVDTPISISNDLTEYSESFYGATSLNIGFFQATNAFHAPCTLINRTHPAVAPAELEYASLETSGPRATLEQVFGYSPWVALSLRGSFADIYTTGIERHYSHPKGYSADADARLFISFCLNSSSNFFVSPVIGFAWHQFHFTSKAVQERDVLTYQLQYFMRYIAPLAGIYFEVQPSKKSRSSIGFVFFFPKAKQRYNLTTSLSHLTDHLGGARHGWSLEYAYRYTISNTCSISFNIEYRDFSISGKNYHRNSASDSPTLPSTASERFISGGFGFDFVY